MRLLVMVVMVVSLSSCVFFQKVCDNSIEVSKTIWGSSTRALEEARDKAITRTYDKSYWDCLRKALEVIKAKDWVIFKKDQIKGYVVIMGVKGGVNTTEIGIFFVNISDAQTRIEIASLSTNARRHVAKDLFHGLDVAFGYLPPDIVPVPPKQVRSQKQMGFKA